MAVPILSPDALSCQNWIEHDAYRSVDEVGLRLTVSTVPHSSSIKKDVWTYHQREGSD